MNLLAQNGIYVIVGLANDPYGANIPQNPGTGQHPYPSQFKARVQTIIGEFKAYPNVLSFEVGNEVTDPTVQGGVGSVTQLNAAAAIKAAANDAKTDMAAHAYRAIPVGVAMVDIPANESTVAQYYASSACNGLPLDYIGINTYRYVPPKGNTKAYEGLVSDYQIGNYTIPVILSEYEAGVTSGARDFLDAPSFYNDPTVSGNISGGFAYQYIADGSGAGSGFALVKLGSGSTGLKGKTDVKNLQPAWPNSAFVNLAAQYKIMQATPPPATVSPGALNCPSHFNPPLCVVGAPNCVTPPPPSTIAITVQANQPRLFPMAVVQGDSQLSPPSPINDSNVHPVTVDPTQQLLLQQTGTWFTICAVAANTLTANSAVTVPATAWGGQCVVTPGQ
jgi:hypothetical protein